MEGAARFNNTGDWSTTLSNLLLLFLFTASSSHAWTTEVLPRGSRGILLLGAPSFKNLHHQRPWAPRTVRLSLSSSSSDDRHINKSATADNNKTKNVEAVIISMLELARALGPVGSRQSPKRQQFLLDACLKLRALSDPAPARIPLTGIHNLVYSASKGGSSGQLLGPIIGQVTQEFVDETVFINAVKLGPLKIALTARREIKSDTVLAVQFLHTRVYLFGKQIVERKVGGGGVWNMIYAGTVRDTDGIEKLVRVLETPSLFIIEQPLT